MEKENKTEEEVKDYISCERCELERIEILYFEGGFLIIRCLNCGSIMKLPYDRDVQIPQSIKPTPLRNSYFG